MSDKVRGAIFNMLGELDGLDVLDAYAGSGALSYEAVSRGAKSIVAIDSDATAYRTILANLEKLGLRDRIRVVRQNVSTWSHDNNEKSFDVVLADPPYDDLRPAYVDALATHVKAGGLLVLSWPGGETLPDLPDMERISNRSYGDAQLGIYRR